MTTDQPTQKPHRLHWHWGPMLVVTLIGIGYGTISSDLRIGPKWLFPSALLLLLAVFILFHFIGNYRLTRKVGFALTLIATIAVGGSVAIVASKLFGSGIPARSLLGDAAILWLSNIGVFGIWYWEIDGGGPGIRHMEGYHPTDLLFPQSSLGGDFAANWTPKFLDYLFVAFNASTAFSPTDTMVLSTRAKALMMAQSLSSIVIIAVLAARAINTLQ